MDEKTGKYANHIMNWNSPWGEGFPGWHIECTAMGTAILGEYFDIHTGGIDHIPVHHPNERAQNLGAFGHGVVKYWIHNEWLVNMDDSKLSKSDGGALTLPDIEKSGFSPLDLRYLFVSINYRTRVQYSTEALIGIKNARESLNRKVAQLGSVKGEILEEYKQRFKSELENNLNMSGIFALINELLKSSEKKEDILATVLDFDRVLGLNLENIHLASSERGIYVVGAFPEEDIDNYARLRDEARTTKDYAKADEYRKKIEDAGYVVLDTPEGTKYQKK